MLGRVVHAGYGVVVEIRLIDDAVGGGDFSAGCAGAEDGGAFELLANHFGVGDDASIERGGDARDGDRAGAVNFNFYDGRDIR